MLYFLRSNIIKWSFYSEIFPLYEFYFGEQIKWRELNNFFVRNNIFVFQLIGSYNNERDFEYKGLSNYFPH